MSSSMEMKADTHTRIYVRRGGGSGWARIRHRWGNGGNTLACTPYAATLQPAKPASKQLQCPPPAQQHDPHSQPQTPQGPPTWMATMVRLPSGTALMASSSHPAIMPIMPISAEAGATKLLQSPPAMPYNRVQGRSVYCMAFITEPAACATQAHQLITQ